MMQMRTHTCNALRLADVGKSVKIVGWMENVREVGSNLAFVVLRDFYGTTQVVAGDRGDARAIIKGLNKESTIQRGRAWSGSGPARIPSWPPARSRWCPIKSRFWAAAATTSLPFQINRSREADETARLKYRYLDLRNPAVKKNIILRCQVVAALRAAMTEHGFLEITTPILTASSPEGARDYLVPARKHPGKFYALPQAPQQFKQLLMTSGFDRYFQIAPCFRDEDARGDRSPGEFYQLDMEMAFATQDDVFAVLEDVLPPIFAKFGTYSVASSAPFRRIPYLEAMETYGSDKPDLRIDLTVQRCHQAALKTAALTPFEGQTVKAMVDITDFAPSPASRSTSSCADVRGAVRQQGPTGSRWMKTASWSGASPSSSVPVREELFQGPGPEAECAAWWLAAGREPPPRSPPGVMRQDLRRRLRGPHGQGAVRVLLDRGLPHVRDRRRESGELEFCHNPFSMPSGGMEILLKAEPGRAGPPGHHRLPVRPGVQRRGAVLRRRA